jgi:uncharacterized protein (TIGR03067 family)
MRRFVYLLAVALLCVVALGSDSPTEYDGRTQVSNPLQGKWRPLKFEVTDNRGGKIIGNGPAWADVVFQDERYSWGWRDGYARLTASRGICTIDPGKRPGHLDLTDLTGQDAGVTRRCIYRLDGETLEIATTTGDPAHRPESFEAPVTTYTLKRVKK